MVVDLTDLTGCLAGWLAVWLAGYQTPCSLLSHPTLPRVTGTLEMRAEIAEYGRPQMKIVNSGLLAHVCAP